MSEELPVRRRSDLLDSILDTVDGTSQTGSQAERLFRPQALEQLDVASEVDNQLPLVSRQAWLLAVGLCLLILGFLAWAALTPSVDSVRADGRMVAPPGLIPVVAPEAGAVEALDVQPGESLAAGATAGSLLTPDGAVPLTSLASGQVWQVLISTGEVAEAGASVLTLLPPGSERSLLAVLAEQQAALVEPGMEVTTASGVAGRVVSVGAPIPADEVSQRTGITAGEPGNYAVVTVGLDASLPAGALVSTTIVLSKSTVLGRVLEGR